MSGFEFLAIPEKYSSVDVIEYQYFHQLLENRTIIFNSEISEDIIETLYLPLRDFENDDSDEGSKTEKTRKIIIIVSSLMCIALVFALILTLVLTKKNRNKKTSDSKTKARKAKEKAKKAKLEAREARRQNKKK